MDFSMYTYLAHFRSIIGERTKAAGPWHASGSLRAFGASDLDRIKTTNTHRKIRGRLCYRNSIVA